MDYKKVHDAIISKAQLENRSKGGAIYYESHHIIPDFMFAERLRNGPKGHLQGDPNDPKNLVLLTEREHIIVHVLLAKALSGIRYWAQAAGAVAFFLTTVIGEHPRQKQRLVGVSRKYAKYRQLGLAGISNARSGMMPAVDSVTGESVGSVSTDHPKVLSGEWQHHCKGKKISNTHREKIARATTGENNPTHIKVSNEEILQTYAWLITAAGTFVSKPFYRKWFEENFGFKPPNFTSKYRFNFGKDLVPTLEQMTGHKHYAGDKTMLALNIKDYPYDKNSQD